MKYKEIKRFENVFDRFIEVILMGESNKKEIKLSGKLIRPTKTLTDIDHMVLVYCAADGEKDSIAIYKSDKFRFLDDDEIIILHLLHGSYSYETRF